MTMLPILLLALRIGPAPDGLAYRQPQLAAAHGQVAVVFGSGDTVYVSTSGDNGRTFSAAVKVAEVGALALGRHRGPRLAILKNALVVSAIGGEKKATGPHAHGLPENGDLRTWRSVDGGKTWKPGAIINDVPGAAREGLHAMAADAKGTLTAVWLDLRDKGTQLYSARSTDAGATWSKNTLVYASPSGSICQCCHPSLSIDAAGQVHVMWRNVVDGNRDLYAATSKDGVRFDAARKLGTGSWKINACPMDGGALAADKDGLVTAWRRESAIYVTNGSGAEEQVGVGKDVALARGKKGTYVAWTKESGIELLKPGAASPVALAEGAFPNLIALPDGSVLAAWETKTSVEIQRLD